AGLAVHAGLGHEDAVVGGFREHLVRIQIVAVPQALVRARLLLEVKARVHEVLAVGEEEIHPPAPFAWTEGRTRTLERRRMGRGTFSTSFQGRSFMSSQLPLVQRQLGAMRPSSRATWSIALWPPTSMAGMMRSISRPMARIPAPCMSRLCSGG